MAAALEPRSPVHKQRNRLTGETRKGLGFLECLHRAAAAWVSLASGSRLRWPQPREYQEQRHQGDEPELVETRLDITTMPLTPVEKEVLDIIGFKQSSASSAHQMWGTGDDSSPGDCAIHTQSP